MVLFLTIKRNKANEKTELIIQRNANETLNLRSSDTVLFLET